MFNASVVSFVTDHLRTLPPGLVYLVVALLVFGEAALFIGFVLPGETSVVVAGVVASLGRVNVVVLVVVVVAAAILGDSLGYEIGKRYGERLLKLAVMRRRRAALERALAGLKRRGSRYVFVGRFTAFLRAVMPGLAGMSEMTYRRFLVANGAGALVWGVGYTLLGYYAGGSLTAIEKYSSWGATAVLVVVVVAVVLAHFARRRRDAGRDETPDPSDEGR